MAAAVTIPLRAYGEVLVVQPDELSEDIIPILGRERADLGVWMDCVRAMVATGRLESATSLLRALIDEARRRADPSAAARFAHVQAMCALADLRQAQARVSADPEARRALYTEANKLYFDAQRVDPQEMLPHLGLGELALSRGDVDTARKEFGAAAAGTCAGAPSVAGALALASLAFRQGQYPEALGLYRHALRRFPGAPAEVRLGLAACLLRLGEVTKAEAAYRRVLELDPGCTHALLGLAVMELAVGASEEATRRGSRLLAQAFSEDPHDPHVLALLAHFSLQQGLAGAALRLAAAARDRADAEDTALRAEATGLLGRAHHAAGELPQAAACYREALELDPSHPTARLARAQLDAARGDVRSAVAALEALAQERGGWADALRLLAPLCPRHYGGGAGTRAAPEFKAAAARAASDAELWEMLGDVTAGSDPATALAAYTKAIALHRAASEESDAGKAGSVPARLLNNAAVLQLRTGDAAAAGRLVAEAIASAVAGGLGALGAQAQVTLGYNAARVREAAGDLKAAEAEYKALLAEFPEYADCYLRLACIAKARGDLRGAEGWAERAEAASAGSADALALLAGLHLADRDLEAAGRYLERMQEGLEAAGGRMTHESYARVALANVHLLSSFKRDVATEAGRDAAEAQLSHALRSYKRALARDPGNIFAANGVGCVLAEAGRLSEAREVFLRVQETAAGSDGFVRLPDAWLNLAGAYAGLGDAGAAAQTYRNAMRRFPEVRDDPAVQLYLAKALYDGGAREEALRTLCKCLHLAPRDARVRFNLAYVQQKLAEVDLARKEWPAGGAGKVAALERALARLASAGEGFRALLVAGHGATGIREKRLKEHVDYVYGQLPAAQALLKAAREEAEAAEKRMEANRARLELEAGKRRLEERRRELEAEAAARAEEERAREAAAKLERLKGEWKAGAALAKAAAAGDAQAAAKNREAERKKKEEDALNALFADEEDDEEYVPGAPEEGDGGGAAPGSGGEEEEPLEGAAALAAAGLLSSDDDDEDFEMPDEEELAAEERAAASAGAKKTKAKKGGKEAKKASKAPKAAKKGGRLKKRAREPEDAASEEAPAAAEDADAGAAEEDSPAKRARQATVLDDLEDEGADAGAADAKMADLFGSDSE